MKAPATLAELVAARMDEIRDLSESGYSELTGKVKRDAITNEIIGRFPGLNIKELLSAGTTPKVAAAAIRRGKGVVYERIKKAVEWGLEKQYEFESLDRAIADATATGQFREARQENRRLQEPPKGSQKGERLEYQLAYAIDKRRHPNTAAAKRRARLHFMDTGRDIAGVHIIAKWRNPDNPNPLHSNWKTTEDPGQSLSEFWRTLHGGTASGGAFGQLATMEDAAEIETVARKVKARAMQRYHERVRSLRKPGWTYKRARAAYRRKFGRKKKR